MKKTSILLLLCLVLFSCQQEEEIPTIAYSVEDVTAVPEYTNCVVTCRSNDVDGNNIHLRLLLSEQESLSSTTAHTMQLSGNVLRCELDGLSEGETYYFAFEIFTSNESYRLEKVYSFTTLVNTGIYVTTSPVTANTPNTAICGGTVTIDNTLTVTSRGVCWSTQSTPTINSSHTTDGSGIGEFTSQLTEMQAGTIYYVRAYATNSLGVAYGNQVTFNTSLASVPTVITNEVISIAGHSATTGGNVTATGGAPVTARGVCWSTNPNPTIANSHTTDGTGTGIYTSAMTGLSQTTTYYVRAYATNSAGTGYGEQQTFTTEVYIPTGGLPKPFSVSATQMVYFSQGNLQYNTTSHQWRFADDQTEIIGPDNVSSGNWIDLFGWGTGNNPTLSSENASDYSTFIDWGVNPISNGGNLPNEWRTLTKDEWEYLLQGRSNANTKIATGKVDNIVGFIILPDDWSLPTGCSFNYGDYNPSAGHVNNNYTLSQWNLMNDAGALFIPFGNPCWSATPFLEDNNNAYVFLQRRTYGTAWQVTAYLKNEKCFVRLVQNY